MAMNVGLTYTSLVMATNAGLIRISLVWAINGGLTYTSLLMATNVGLTQTSLVIATNAGLTHTSLVWTVNVGLTYSFYLIGNGNKITYVHHVSYATKPPSAGIVLNRRLRFRLQILSVKCDWDGVTKSMDVGTVQQPQVSFPSLQPHAHYSLQVPESPP